VKRILIGAVTILLGLACLSQQPTKSAPTQPADAPEIAVRVAAPETLSPSFVFKDTRFATLPFLFDIDGDGTSDYVFPAVNHGRYFDAKNIPSLAFAFRGFKHSYLSKNFTQAAAYSGKTGARLWQYDAGRAILFSHLDKKDGLLILSGDAGNVAAVNLRTGKQAWSSIPREGSIVYMMAAKGLIYAVNSDNRLYCLDESTGKLLWKAHLKAALSKDAYVPHRYVLLCNDVLVAADLRGRLYGYDPGTGKLKWKANTHGKTELVGHKGALVFVKERRRIAAVRLLTGKPAWKHKILVRNLPPPALVGNRLYILEFDPKDDLRVQMTCIDASDGGTRWTRVVSKRIGFPARGCVLHIKHDLVVWGGSDLLCLDDRMGVVRWHDVTPDSIPFWLAIGPGKIILPALRNCLIALDIQTGEVAWRRCIKGSRTPLFYNRHTTIACLLNQTPPNVLDLLDFNTGQIVAASNCPGADAVGAMRDGTIIVSGKNSYIFRTAELEKAFCQGHPPRTKGRARQEGGRRK